jgi:hypothetical protein
MNWQSLIAVTLTSGTGPLVVDGFEQRRLRWSLHWERRYIPLIAAIRRYHGASELISRFRQLHHPSGGDVSN